MIKNKENITIGILILFYTVGIAGLSIPSLRDFMVLLSPMNLLLTLGLFLWVNQPLTSKFWVSVFVVAIFGIWIEMLGVNTGLVFGEYWYGKSLGYKVLGTPLIIGVNWVLLVFTAFKISSLIFDNQFLQSISTATMMVLLDILIEPVAVKLDFWHWKNEIIPIQNFVGWWITAFLLSLFVSFQKLEIKRKVSLAIFGLQVVFFGILNLILS